MTAKDNITLPREVVEKALEALDSEHHDIQLRAAIALRTALAAEPTKQEPGLMEGLTELARQMKPLDADMAAILHDNLDSLYIEDEPALAAEQPKHPGYIIGSHWLETAYSRICAGEAEADVLRDIGLVREEAFLTGVAHLKAENERLRRDAERWRHWRDSHGFAKIDHEGGRCFVTLICDCDDPDQVRAKRFRGEDSFEWLDAFTDAAMEGT